VRASRALGKGGEDMPYFLTVAHALLRAASALLPTPGLYH
jgi:hypothetical protein